MSHSGHYSPKIEEGGEGIVLLVGVCLIILLGICARKCGMEPEPEPLPEPTPAEEVAPGWDAPVPEPTTLDTPAEPIGC